MRKTDLKDLLEVVEKIREEVHPHLDKRFLEAVVQAEENNPDDNEGAIKIILAALNAAESQKGSN